VSPPVIADAGEGELAVRPAQEEDDAVSPLGRAAGHDHLVVLSWTEYTRLPPPSRRLSTW
jgi:hypothetical protein